MLPDLTPDLEPVKAFHEADEVEAQLKALTLDVFREHLRSQERELAVYGAPHLASFSQVERWVKADGLAMVRGESEDAMRYLFKAWRGRNPKRGLHFLRTYLQLLWPSGWEVNQLWQKKSGVYPKALFSKADLERMGVNDPSANYFLTSRVNVDVTTDEDSGAGLYQVARSLRYVCGAKFVVSIRTLRQGKTPLAMASTGMPTMFLGTSGKSGFTKPKT